MLAPFAADTRSDLSRRVDWPRALALLRDAGARFSRVGAETSLPEALRLIAGAAVDLLGADPADGATAVIYTYDAARGAFDPASRISAGEGDAPLTGDVPRPDGRGALAIALRARVLSYEAPAIRFHPRKFSAGIRTAACYPLLVAGQPVGALYIDLRSDRRFSDDELLLLDAFVAQAAVAIHNTRQFEDVQRALRRRLDELERLRQAERAISSRLSLDDTLREILAAALALTGAEHGSFRLLDRASNTLRLRALQPAPQAPVEDAGLGLDDGGSVMGWVARHRRPALIPDLREPPWSAIYFPLRAGAGAEMRSELAVPLLGSGAGLEGVLNVESPRPGAFDLDHQRALESLATQAVIALQQAGLLETIAEVSAWLARSVSAPDGLFMRLVERACGLLQVSDSALWECDPAPEDGPARGGTLTLRASTRGFPPRYRVPLEGSLLGSAVRGGHPVVSADLNADPRVLRPELARQMGWQSALVVPVVARNGAPRGALGVYTVERREFSDWDARTLTALANHAAAALQQSEAVAQLRSAEERHAVAETFAVLGDVAANLLHRVNNLIGAIPARIQGIEAKRPHLLADAYVANALREVEASAREAMQAARETFTHLRPLRLKPTAVAPACQGLAARLSLPPRIQLVLAGLDALPPVLAGAEQLQLVIGNLVENAADAIGQQPGRIVVRGRVAPDRLDPARRWVEIRVEDNGPGVPPEVSERIFDADFSTKGSPQKLGFGLWWAKTLVQRCGGSLALESAAAAAAGSAFVVRLPPAGEARP